MAPYKYLNSDRRVVIRIADNLRFYPEDNLEYQDWLASGGVPDLEEAPSMAELAAAVRADRDARIATVAWRYERHAREIRLGLTPTDDLAALDAYVQALADVPAQAGFPASVVWPA